MKYLVFNPPNPDWDFHTFDFDRDVTLVDRWGQLANAKNPDLSAFRKRGGKLLMTYGWADGILQPMMGVNYYEAAVAKNGPKTTDFLRLFMVPGMAHCGGGVGPDQNDAVSAMIDWVEKEQGAGRDRREKNRRRSGGAEPSTLSLPAGRAIQRQRQHRRRREFQLRCPVEIRPGPPEGGHYRRR